MYSQVLGHWGATFAQKGKVRKMSLSKYWGPHINAFKTQYGNAGCLHASELFFSRVELVSIRKKKETLTAKLCFNLSLKVTCWMISVVWLMLEDPPLVKGATVVAQLYSSPNYQMQS